MFLWTQESLSKRGLKTLMNKYSKALLTLSHNLSPYTWPSVMLFIS